MSTKILKHDGNQIYIRFENEKKIGFRKHEMPTAIFIQTNDEACFTWKSQSAWYLPEYVAQRGFRGTYLLKNTIVTKRMNGFIFKYLKTMQLCGNGRTYID